MQKGNYLKIGLAAVLLLALCASIFWLLGQASHKGSRRSARSAGGTNLALDLRYTYDATVFRPTTYDGAAEFPLRLEGSDFAFYGKRIRGAGKILAKEPGPILYDFVGSQHSEVFEYWYKLKPQGEPKYEDCKLQGRLALHQSLSYLRDADSRGWPPYFPESLRGTLQDDGTRSGGADTAYIEGWTLFGSEDLFFFYVIGSRQLTPDEVQACVDLINSMQFNAIGANVGEKAKPEDDKKDKDQKEDKDSADENKNETDKDGAAGEDKGKSSLLGPPETPPGDAGDGSQNSGEAGSAEAGG